MLGRTVADHHSDRLRTARVECRTCSYDAGPALLVGAFKGLGLIEEIKRDLVQVLQRTRHKSLLEIVGADAAQITAEPWPI
jgi:hypothetical protein